MFDFSLQKQVSKEVYHSVSSQIRLEKMDIEELKSLALRSSRERVRLCSHQTPEEPVHEMFIVHPQNAYVRPHKHLRKIESMMVLQGEVEYITFDDQGKIDSKIPMGDFTSGKVFYNSLRAEIYHTILIHSEWLVFFEITQGPFLKTDSVFPEWSPVEDDFQGVEKFMHELNHKS
jgi:cupin fold WbuC family metalloprotein